jgi:hypothetical protein
VKGWCWNVFVQVGVLRGERVIGIIVVLYLYTHRRWFKKIEVCKLFEVFKTSRCLC